jgi:protein TilB
LAAQQYEDIREALLRHQATLPPDSIATEDNFDDDDSEEAQDPDVVQQKLEETRNRFATEKVAFTPQARLKAARDLAKLREKKESVKSNKDRDQPKKPRPLFTPTGRPLQLNEGKYDFSVRHTRHTLRLMVQIPKFIDTSLIDVMLEADYIRITVKDKRFQLAFTDTDHVQVSKCEVFRNHGDGVLIVDMLRENVVTEKMASEMYRSDVQEEDRKKKKAAEENKREGRERKFVPEGVAMMRRKLATCSGKVGGMAIAQGEAVVSSVDDFQDDPDVPPLE